MRSTKTAIQRIPSAFKHFQRFETTTRWKRRFNGFKRVEWGNKRELYCIMI